MKNLSIKKIKKYRYGGLYGSSPTYYIKKLSKDFKNIIILLDNNTEINNLANELQLFFDEEFKINKFLDIESLPYETPIIDNDINGGRIDTYRNLITHEKNITISSYSATMKRLMPVGSIKKFFTEIDSSHNYNDLINKITKFNYQRTNEVRDKGEFSIRGPIIDIFPITGKKPIRIVFDNNKIEKIKEFDVENQKTSKDIKNFFLTVTNEINLTDSLVNTYKKNCHKFFDKDYFEDAEYEKITSKILYPTIFNLLPLFYNTTSTLFELFDSSNTTIITTKNIGIQIKKIEDLYKKYYRKLYKERYILNPNQLILTTQEYKKILSDFYNIELSTYKLPIEVNNFNVNIKKLPYLQLSNTFKDPYKNLKNFLVNTTYKVLICIRRESLRNNIENILKELKIRFNKVEFFNDFIQSKDKISITNIPIHDGFFDNDDKIAIISDRDIFGSRSISKPKSSSKRNIIDEYISDMSSLELDAPIVHDNHGVGRYKGLLNMDVEGIQTELVKIEYADEDILYIPVTSINLIKKYAGRTGLNVPLHKLGTNQWVKIKNKAKKKINDIAVELLEVHSKRLINKGFSFNIDFSEYRIFCEKFPFVETEDQLRAINEVLSGMSSNQPMDRLICGDVGFGKTEIIMRASFIASLNEKQTIILAPTTILVEQHYKTFQKRFEDTPIIIKKLSRLQVLSQRKKILDLFKLGRIDILIGTHALLSNLNNYKNVGLLIIDEEHKFGVTAKEKIKKIKTNIDVITLTATPIPRTLNAALSQIKDLSVIETPPENRKAISTLILEWDENIITDAIQRELQRGGQIYFVHNEIKTIENEIKKLHKITNNFRIGIIHGQLSNKKIENEMDNFLNNKIDILMCTSIIESGLDIQNVNTIIINHANKFGLSQLHQIRGRVGRTSRQAYAYLILDNKKSITKDASKRLEAIDSVNSLGGGLELATHDLEIRGAGELLGEQQSGQIYEIGYAMFTEMLTKSINFLKTGKYQDENQDFEVDVNIPALIPQDYVNDIFTRLTYYKKISSQKTINQLNEVEDELVDRFGPIPENLENLFKLTTLKIQISKFNINYLKITDSFIRVKFKNEKDIDINKILSTYKNDKSLKILDNGLIQYKGEFSTFENQCKFIREFSSKIN